MVEARLRPLRSLRAAGGARGTVAVLAHAVAWAGLLALAVLFAWRNPGPNLYPAAALGFSLLLDGAGRIAGDAIARRAGPDPRLSGLPSLVLGIGGTIGLLAATAALLLFPRAVPVLASALAGLFAIGALARLALIRVVLGLSGDGCDGAAADPDPPRAQDALSRR